MIESSDRSLAGDIEQANRFNLIAEELHSYRILIVGSEQIDQAASTRKIADFFDQRHAPEPQSYQSLA